MRLRARLVEQAAQVAHVGGRADEREREEVDAELQRELEVDRVLARERGDRDRHSRQVDALVLADAAADEHRAARTALLDVLDDEPHEAVVDQHLVTGTQDFAHHRRHHRQRTVRRDGLADDRDLFPALEDDRLGELADPELRPLEVRDHRQWAAGLALGVAHAPGAFGVLLVRPVREVQARRVHAGGDECAQRFRRVARGAERGDDLRTAWRFGRHGVQSSDAGRGTSVERAGRPPAT